MPLTVNTNSFQVGGVSAGSGGLDAAAVQAEIAKTSPYKHLQTVVMDNADSVLLNAPEIANYSSAWIILDSVKLNATYQGLKMRFIISSGTYTSNQYGYSFHGTNEVGSRIGGGGSNKDAGHLIIVNTSYMPFGDVGGQIVCTGMAEGSRPIAVSRLGSGRASSSNSSEAARAYNCTVTADGLDGVQVTGFELYPSYSSPKFTSGRISIYGLNTHD